MLGVARWSVELADCALQWGSPSSDGVAEMVAEKIEGLWHSHSGLLVVAHAQQSWAR